MILSVDQQAAVNAQNGVFVCIAGPGSGKTSTLIRRYLQMLANGIPSKDMLNLTFTNSAAKEMVHRVGLLDAESVFRTFHSFAIDLLKKEKLQLPFQVCDTIIPIAMQDYELLFQLTKTYPAIKNFRVLQEAISNWKKSNVQPKQAVEEATGMEFFYAKAYEDYERKCRQEGWLDFDSLMYETVKLLETNEGVRERHKRKYISVDECQDTDVIQFRLLQLIFDGNIFVVGDENQCQIPGTKISVVRKEKRGRQFSVLEEIPIEKLSKYDRLLSWDVKQKRIRIGVGRKFKRAVRNYFGDVLKISCNGKTTTVTPNHFIWAKFNRASLEQKSHLVYLMFKKDLGFRVGTSKLRTACGSNQISHRGYQEKADAMWILDVVENEKKARVLETIYSIKYGIPQTRFESSDAKEIFSESNFPWGGLKLLEEKDRDYRYPFVTWSGKKHLTKFHGYFKTVAANLIPGIMDLPTAITYKSALIDSVVVEQYEGPVYSLEVEKDHTYVADGIPVGNCIYEWRSAQADSLSKISKYFPESQTLYLGENYRSTPELVEFLKEILPVDNGLASRMTTKNAPGVEPTFVKYADDVQECERVLASVTDPENTAVISRTNRQLFIFQRTCTMRSIKYKILGKKDFWEMNEIKKLLNLAKGTTDSRPASAVLSDLIRNNNLIEVYRHTGKPMETSPAENLNSIVKMAAGKGSIVEFLIYLNKLTRARKSKKGLTLSTVHQAKGREWDNVFVIGAKQGTMPHDDGELQEEKRIFFVAASRAAKRLEISYHGQMSQFYSHRANEIKTYQPEAENVGTEIQIFSGQ